MEPITLGTGGLILVLSSFIALFILLKRQFHKWMNTSFYALSISDILYSVLTASILFLNYSEMAGDEDYSMQANKTFAVNNVEWSKQQLNGSHHRVSFTHPQEDNTTVESNHEASSQCNVTNLIMQYAMFLAPLTNSFVSLLIFSVQCNLEIHCIKNQCMRFLQAHRSGNEANERNVDNREKIKDIETLSFGSESSVFDSNSRFKGTHNNKLRFLQNSRFDRSKKNDKRILSGLLISQWIIPMIVTGALYFAEYDDMNHIKQTEHMQCVSEGSSFFDNCHKNDNNSNDEITIQPGKIEMPLHNNYLSNEDLVRASSSNKTEVNEIISKVQSIVDSLLNDTLSRPISFYNNSELQDITEHMQSEANFSFPMKTNSVVQLEIVATEENVKAEDATVYDSEPHSEDEKNPGDLENTTDTQSTELLLVTNLMQTTSGENNVTHRDTLDNGIDVKISESTQFPCVQETSTNSLDVTQSTTPESAQGTKEHNTINMTRNEIYADIIRRIHGIAAQSSLKNRHKVDKNYSRKQPKQNSFTEQEVQDYSYIGKDTVLILKSGSEQWSNTEGIPLSCMGEKCFFSQKFIRLHLLALVFTIYFLPILISIILQVQAKLLCRIIVAQLGGRLEVLDASFNESKRNIADQDANTVTDIEVISGPSKWFPENEAQDLNEGSSGTSISSVEVRMKEDKDFKGLDKGHKMNISIQDEKQNYSDVKRRLQKVEKLVDTAKVSLFCGILLWTPVFLELLLKVFTCLHVPELLLDITYFSAIAFGSLRNVFNLKIIKLQDTDEIATGINRVHPT